MAAPKRSCARDLTTADMIEARAREGHNGIIERVVEGRREHEVARVRITKAGRRVLAKVQQ